MRFGIMAMQLEALVPQGVPAEQIMASIMSFDHAGLAKSLFAFEKSCPRYSAEYVDFQLDKKSIEQLRSLGYVH